MAMVITTLSLSPNIATAIDPCESQITKSGVTASSSDVEVTSYSIYCVAKFKTVASDYRFTVPVGITKLDYLVVGGGGGGASGGGGAGGVLMANDYAVTPGTAITVSVGRGGDGGAGGNSVIASKGSPSTFGNISAQGGGRGGASGVGGTDVNGASGGGSRFDCTGSGCGNGIAGTSTAGQGNNGGYSTYNSYGAGGGGGGAGGAGFNTTRNYIGGNGGIGITSDITGTSTYYGGGGGGGINSNDNQYVGLNASSQLIYSPTTAFTNGGGQGGLGGGGRGSSWGRSGGVAGAMANATAGAPNTGGGGGGTDPEDINAAAGGSGVVILRWVSNVNLKTLTFNSNTPTPTTTTQRVGSGVVTPLSLNSFSRTGYVFTGWTTAQDGTGTVYADGDPYTTSTDVTLYAKWAAGVTKTITFDRNGGSGSMTAQVAGTSVAINPNEFARSNYTFNGWNTAANGSGFAYSEGAIFSFQEDTTLYAQWQPVVATYRVTFYGNAADGGTTASQSASTTTPLNLNGFTRTGFNFLGWNTNYSSGSATYRDGQNYAFTSDVNLYAIWVAQTNNNLVYDGNGSTSGSTAGQTANSSTMLRANGFARTGYTFKNWNTAADGTGASYQSNYVYSFAAGLTLYAQWGAHYTVSYDANTSDTGTVPSAQNSYVGSPGLNLPLNTGSLKKAGYRLAGWNDNQAGTGTPYALGASSVKFTSDKVLYAQWAPAVYSVIYAANGAAAGIEPSPVTFTYGSTLTVARNTGQLEKPGFTFSGWATAPDGTGQVFEPDTPNVALSNDTVLFAKWVSIASVPVSGNTNTVPSPSPSPSPSSKVSVFPKTITISGFANGSSKMTPSMRSKIKIFLAQNPGFNQIKITGYTEGPTILKADERLSRSRAVTARNYIISSLNYNSAKTLLSAVTFKTKSSDLRRIKITLAR